MAQIGVRFPLPAPNIFDHMNENVPERDRKVNLPSSRGETVRRIEEIIRTKISQRLSAGEDSLTHEQLEIIIDKLEDIFEKGTAYVSLVGINSAEKYHKLKDLDEEKFWRVFQEGLLGNRRHYAITDEQRDLEKHGNTTKEKWATSSRQYHQSDVRINIVGRSIPPTYDVFSDEFRTEFEKPIISTSWGYPILFLNIDNLTEEPPFIMDVEERNEYQNKSGTYRIIAPRYLIDFNEKTRGSVGVSAEYGFSVANRIAPRNFRGIMVDDDCAEQVIRMLQEMIQKNNTATFIPVYGKSGELIWPLKMSRKEVLQYLGKDPERDEGKVL